MFDFESLITTLLDLLVRQDCVRLHIGDFAVEFRYVGDPGQKESAISGAKEFLCTPKD
jgi:hypothetical protein